MIISDSLWNSVFAYLWNIGVIQRSVSCTNVLRILEPVAGFSKLDRSFQHEANVHSDFILWNFSSKSSHKQECLKWSLSPALLSLSHGLASFFLLVVPHHLAGKWGNNALVVVSLGQALAWNWAPCGPPLSQANCSTTSSLILIN